MLNLVGFYQSYRLLGTRKFRISKKTVHLLHEDPLDEPSCQIYSKLAKRKVL